MAVTLDVAGLAAALGKAADDPAVVRLHPVGVLLVDAYADGAPEAIANEALIRCVSYQIASPGATGGVRRLRAGDIDHHFQTQGSALRLSGAMALLAPYRKRRAIRVWAS